MLRGIRAFQHSALSVVPNSGRSGAAVVVERKVNTGEG